MVPGLPSTRVTFIQEGNFNKQCYDCLCSGSNCPAGGEGKFCKGDPWAETKVAPLAPRKSAKDYMSDFKNKTAATSLFAKRTITSFHPLLESSIFLILKMRT